MTTPPLALVSAFTVIFAITGVRSLVRLLVPVDGGDRTAELSHLLMSIAMAGMAWGWPAGPDTPGGVAQLVVFGVLAVVFVVRVVDPAEPPSAGNAFHLLALGAMVWMVLSMPASHGHDGHAAPAVTQLITIAFVVVLCATPFARVLRASGSAGHVLMSGGMAAMLLAML
ncbi:DUF5134 domain-containing protein [Pseudonocardia adelaidensis]|uniref:DUF5134 domain-containing protein n=1 Tax=Pseudonocardia adelaidensis TaxID=648754 RepID=A0ABP9NJ26_9PSEU